MKASILRSSFILFTLALFSHEAAGAESCARLTDEESTFRSSLGKIDGVFSGGNGGGEAYGFDFWRLQNAIDKIDSVAPWLSQCIASVNVGSVATTVFSSARFQSCYADIAQGVKALDDDTKSVKLFADHVCPMYNEAVMPCLNEVLVDEILMPAIQDPCCDDFKAMIYQAFGADLPTEIKTLSNLVGNAICSTKTFRSKNGQSANQTCGDALVATFVNSTDGSEIFDTVQDAMQIPTEQVCAAVVGKEVVLASGKKTTFPADTNGTHYGICFQPMSELVAHVSAYPVLYMLTVSALGGPDIPLSNMFTDGSCMPMMSLFMTLYYETGSLGEAFGVMEAIENVFGTGPSSVAIDSWNGGGGDSLGDSGDSASKSVSGWLSSTTSMGLGARMLRAAETWSILITTSDDGEGSEGPTSADGSSDYDAEPAPQWPGFTLPTIDLTSGDASASGDNGDYQVCLHFPHGVPCDFSSSSITLPYPESASTRRLDTRHEVALRTVANVIRRLRQ